MIAKYIANVKAKGVSNAQAIYDKMRARVAHYEK